MSYEFLELMLFLGENNLTEFYRYLRYIASISFMLLATYRSIWWCLLKSTNQSQTQYPYCFGAFYNFEMTYGLFSSYNCIKLVVNINLSISRFTFFLRIPINIFSASSQNIALSSDSMLSFTKQI